MALWLKQSTAATIPMGPFVDSTDGVTPETALSLTQAETRLSKNGAAFAQKNDANAATHGEEGNYLVTLDATDTNTLGRLRISIYVAGALPVWQDCMVLPANVWDSLFGADKLEVDVAQWLGTAAATPTVAGVPEVDVTHFNGTAGTFALGRPEVNTSHIAGSAVSTASAQIGVNVVNAGGTAWASGAITAAAIAADAITAAKVAADVSAEIADAVWDEDATAHQTQGTFGQAIGDPGADTDTLFGLVNTNLDATVSSRLASASYTAPPSAAANADAVWDEARSGHITAGSFGEGVASVQGNVTGSVASVTGAVGSVTGAVGSVTGNVGGNVTGSVGSVATGGIAAASFAAGAIDAAAIAASAIGASELAADAVAEIADGVWDEATSGHITSGSYGDKLGAHLPTVLKVIVGSGSTTTAVVLNATTGIDGAAPSAVNDFYNGRVLVFTSGALAGQATDITDYVGSTVTLTVTALTGAPAADVTAVIV